jgi:hypothetical protein
MVHWTLNKKFKFKFQGHLFTADLYVSESFSLPPPLNPTPVPANRMPVDLSLLGPLWNLYNKITAKTEDSALMQQPVIRALTELFLQAENLAVVSLMIDNNFSLNYPTLGNFIMSPL